MSMATRRRWRDTRRRTGSGVAGLVVGLLLAASAPRAGAQTCIDCGGPNAPPSVSITSPSDGAVLTTSSVTVQIYETDDQQSILSRDITVNGAAQSVSWSYLGSDGVGDTWEAAVSLSPGTNTIDVTVTDNLNQPGSASITVSLTSRQPPVVSVAPHPMDFRATGLCVLDCADGTLGYATPSYTSLDTPRSVTLAYRSSQAAPVATVSLDVTDNSSTTASTMSIKLRDVNGAYVSFLGGRQETFFAGGAGTSRLTALFDASGLATGAYNYTAVVSSYWSDGQKMSTEVPVRVLVVNERNSPYGAGWTVLGVQIIYPQQDGGAAITDGTGSIVRFGPQAGSACANAPPGMQCTSPAPCGPCTLTPPTGEFTRLLRYASPINGATWERQYPDSGHAYYDASGRMISYKDRFGNQTSYSYSGTGPALATVTDPVGKITTFGYDGASHTVTITDPVGRSSVVTLNGSNDATNIRNPALQNVITSASYDASHRLTGWTNELGARTTFAYHWTKTLRLVTLPSVKLDNGSTATPTIQIAAWQTTAAEADTVVNSQSMPHARVIGDSLYSTVTDPRGFTTRFYTDKLGQPKKIRDAIGRTETYAYNDAGQLLTKTAVDGSTESFGWTGPNMTFHTTPVGSTSYYYTASFPNLLSRTYDGFRETRYAYDAAGCLVQTQVGADTVHVKRSTFVCDSRGRTTVATDPRGHRTRTAYSPAGLQNTDSTWVTSDTTDAYKRRVKYTRDSIGRVIATTDPMNRTTVKRYDILNRDSLTVGQVRDTTKFVYDGLGLRRVTDAIGQVYRFEKNALGWDTLAVDPSGYSQSYGYDIMGNVLSWKNRRGQITRFTYDSLGRPSTMTLANGRVTTYKYDPQGLWYAVANQNTADTVKITADRRTLYEISVRSGKTYLVTSYLANGRKTGMRFDFVGRKYARDQVMAFYYDSVGADPKTGLLYGLAQTGFNERRTNLIHNDDQQVSRVELPIGSTFTATVDKSYSSAHGLIGERYSNNTAYDTLYGRGYSRDSLGRITASYRPVGDKGRLFRYDSAGRISQYTDFTATSGWTNCSLAQDGGCSPNGSITSQGTPVTYTYDAVGNRTDSGAVIQPGNRMTQIAGYSYTFDADGNVITRVGGGVSQTLYWNSINQLDSVATSNNGMIRFYYDGFGRRTRKGIPNFAWNYHYSGMQLYADSKDDAGIVHVYKYYPGTDEVVSVTDWDKTYHFTKDASGNVTGAINEELGTASNSYKYTPFGQIESSTEGFSNAIRFKGRYQDGETGLYENRARYYDPVAGRFISQDPIGLAGGINPYAYGENDPMNMSDPFGLDPCSEEQKSHGWKTITNDNGDTECVSSTTLDEVKVVGTQSSNFISYISITSPVILTLTPGSISCSFCGAPLPQLPMFTGSRDLPPIPVIGPQPPWRPSKPPIDCVLSLDKLVWSHGFATLAAGKLPAPAASGAAAVIAANAHLDWTDWKKDCAPPE